MRTIDEFNFPVQLLKKLYINKIVVGKKSQDLSRILKKHPKLLVAVSHGPVVGALSGFASIVEQFQKNSGYNRKPFGIAWRGFYQIPGTKQLFSYMTQVKSGLNFDESINLLTESDFTDCFMMPEGELCLFGNGLDIQPFLSPRFIELAIKANIPVLVAAQKGAENWAWPVNVNEKYHSLFNWLPKNMKNGLKQSSLLNIPKPLYKKVNSLYVSFYLYQPTISEWDLSDDKEERKEQLWNEANRVRAKMQKMVNELVAESDDK